MKKILVIILLLVVMTFCVSCGSKDNNEDTGKKEEQTITYNIRFEGTDLKDQKIEAGESIAQPQDPEKKDQIFTGWFLDSNYKTLATFPYVVNSDTTFYAKFDSNENAFKVARDNTIGSKVSSYEYDYETVATASYGTTGVNGKTVGNAKYKKNNELSFYDEHVNSGLLFIDGTKLQIKNKNVLQHVSLNGDGEVTKVEAEQVDDSYKFDSSSFAKALFEYQDSQLKSITKTNNPNEYLLKTSFGFSQAVSVLGNNLNNSMVEKLIGSLPETSVDTGMLVTIKNGFIDTYEYYMNIAVTAITFNLTYTLKFKNIDNVADITVKNLEGVSLNETDIQKMYTSANAFVNTYKTQEGASYDYTLKTAVGFSGKNNIDAKFSGSSIRKNISGTTYFYNDIDIATNYDNADLYKDAGIKDIHVKKTKLSNGEVWFLEKKTLSTDTSQVTNYVDSTNDSLLFLLITEKVSKFSYSVEKNDTKENELTYSIGLNNEGVTELLTWLNEFCDIDPLNKASVDVQIFGDFSNVKADEAVIKIVLSGGILKSIEVDISGTMDTKLNSSRDFQTKQNVTFSVELEINVTNAFSTFTPFDTAKDAK